MQPLELEIVLTLKSVPPPAELIRALRDVEGAGFSLSTYSPGLTLDETIDSYYHVGENLPVYLYWTGSMPFEHGLLGQPVLSDPLSITFDCQLAGAHPQVFVAVPDLVDSREINGSQWSRRSRWQIVINALRLLIRQLKPRCGCSNVVTSAMYHNDDDYCETGWQSELVRTGTVSRLVEVNYFDKDMADSLGAETLDRLTFGEVIYIPGEGVLIDFLERALRDDAAGDPSDVSTMAAAHLGLPRKVL